MQPVTVLAVAFDLGCGITLAAGLVGLAFIVVVADTEAPLVPLDLLTPFEPLAPLDPRFKGSRAETCSTAFTPWTLGPAGENNFMPANELVATVEPKNRTITAGGTTFELNQDKIFSINLLLLKSIIATGRLRMDKKE